MNGRQFGPCLASDGTRFRLWAPAAKRVDVMLEHPRARIRGEDGWFTADIAGVKAGLRKAESAFSSSSAPALNLPQE